MRPDGFLLLLPTFRRCFFIILSVALGLAFGHPAQATVPLLDLPHGARITVVGGAYADILMRDAFLEATFLEAFPEKQLVFHSLAFPGAKVPDTDSAVSVLKDALAELGTQCVWAFYGVAETLADAPAEVSFEERLRFFTKQMLSSRSNGDRLRLVLFGPPAQEPFGAPQGPVAARNAALKRTSETVAAVAREFGVPFVDLFTASERLFATSSQRAALLPKQWGRPQSALTVHGHLFRPEANRLLAPLVFDSLTRVPPKNDAPPEALLLRIREKHSAWRRAFLQMPEAPEPGAWRALESGASTPDARPQTPELENRDGKASPEPSAPNPIRPLPFKIAAAPSAQTFADNTAFPDLTPPIQMRWDAQGRLWVLCPEDKAGRHKLLVLTDQDGDGQADPTEAGSVQSISLDPSGRVLLRDSQPTKVQVETLEGSISGNKNPVYLLDPLNGHVEIPQEFVSLKETRLYAAAKPQSTADGTWIPADARATPLRPPLAQQSVKELLGQLTSPEGKKLPHIRNALASRPASEVLPALFQWAAGLDKSAPFTERHRLQALWLSRWFGQADNGLLEAALRSPDAEVRIEAVRIVRETRETLAQAARLLEPLSRDADARVRLEVLLAAGCLATHNAYALGLVHNIAAQPMDPVCERLAREVLARLEPDPSRILLPENPRALRFVLSGLSDAMLERAPQVEAVWMEQVDRDGTRMAALEAGLRSLTTLHGSSRAAEIAAALRRLQAAKLERGGHFEKLLSMALEAPAAELHPAEGIFGEVASGLQPGVLRVKAHAVWLKADGAPQNLWMRLNNAPERQIELLKALELLNEPALRAAFHPVLKQTLALPEHAPGLLEAALTSLPLTGPQFAAENIVLLQAQILAARAMPEAASALLQLPPETWTNAELLKADALLAALRRWQASVPQPKQGDAAKRAASEVIKRIEDWQKTIPDCTD
ncbi:MAG: hypothetical protein EBS01_05790 [Verrucomicrobia bacterium]|nr:hypothetical protein [Verrucomicrobiota bacterium]